MKRIVDITLIICLAALICGGWAWPEEKPIDLTGVTRIDMTGAAISAQLETSPSGPYQAAVGGRPKGRFFGWYSSWFLDDCGANARMRIDGTTLFAETPPPSWFDSSDCIARIHATLPPGAAIKIAQSATQAQLSGDFAAVRIESAAADIDLRGHADEVAISSDALRLRLAYRRADRNEAVRLDGHMIDADLDFGGVPAIDYAIEANASWVSRAPNIVPGASPLLRIKGDLVRATVR